VQEAFSWGSGALHDHIGPDEGQIDILSAVRDGLSLDKALQIAIASGHGVGKSPFVAWHVLCGVSTETDTRGVVTANAEVQLRTKTWAEVAKWGAVDVGRDARLAQGARVLTDIAADWQVAVLAPECLEQAGGSRDRVLARFKSFVRGRSARI
jgi:hypothetical protein